MGIVPVVWLLALRSAGKHIAPVWWGLAGAFGVSWLADWVSHITGTFPVGPIYLLLQTGLIVFLLTPGFTASRFTAVLVGTTSLAMTRLDLQSPDVFVHTVAWLGLLAVLWPLPLIPSLRWTFGIAFGLGWLAWLGYCLRPGWASWLTYQGVRAASLGVFCWASTHPRPMYASA